MYTEQISYSNPNLYLNIKSLFATESTPLLSCHCHREIEIVEVLSGKLVCEIDGKRIHLKDGNCIIINSNRMHNLEVASDVSYFNYIQINIYEYANKFLGLNFDNPTLIMFDKNLDNYKLIASDNIITEAMRNIVTENNNHNNLFDIAIQGYILQILAYMSRNNLIYDIDRFKHDVNVNMILPALKYIENFFTTKITIEDISKTVNINKYSFCKKFKSIMGYTCVEYINLRRLICAEKLLVSTDKSISDIAFESGFSTIQNFNKCFKNHRGCSPVKFKKMYINFAKNDFTN